MNNFFKSVKSSGFRKMTEVYKKANNTDELSGSYSGKDIFFGFDGEESTYLAMWYISQSKKKSKTNSYDITTTYVPTLNTDTVIDYDKALEDFNIHSQAMSQVTKVAATSQPWTIDEVMEQWSLLISELRQKAIPFELPILLPYQKPIFNLFAVKLQSISLNQKLIESNEQQEAFSNYYVCVATSGMKVLSTKILKDADMAHINTDMIFDNLLPNFTITLSVYSLGSRNQQLVDQQKETKWAKIMNIFKWESIFKDSAIDLSPKTQFNLVGKCVLDKNMFEANTKKINLDEVPEDTMLDGRMVLTYKFYP